MREGGWEKMRKGGWERIGGSRDGTGDKIGREGGEREGGGGGNRSGG